MPVNASLLELLLEVQALDRVPRMGYLLRGVAAPESVTEHGWQLLFLVWVLGPRVPGLDLLRAVELALVHDLAELRTGDLPRTARHYLPDGVKHEAEAEAVTEILAPLGDRGKTLYAEYLQGDSVEARFVRACDKLQLMLKVTVYESWGARALGDFWDHPENFPDDAFEPVRQVIDELRRRQSKG